MQRGELPRLLKGKSQIRLAQAAREPSCGLNRSFSLFLNAAAITPPLDCLRAVDAEQSRRECDMRRLFSQFLADQSGATAIEYALIAAGISIVIVTVVNGIGTQVNAKFAAVSTALK